MAHLLPHTHAQTNHGAPAVHRDNTRTVVRLLTAVPPYAVRTVLGQSLSWMRHPGPAPGTGRTTVPTKRPLGSVKHYIKGIT